MSRFNTGNPIGSDDGKDLSDNAKNLDVLMLSQTDVSFPDRLGVERKTWHGIEQQAKIDVDAAVASATQQAEGFRDEAQDARDDAVAAAGSIGPLKFYETYAQAMADSDNWPTDGLVEIARDETRDGARTRYRPDGAILEFVVNLDQLRIDIIDPTGEDAVGGLSDYAKLRAYSGDATTLEIIDPSLYGRFIRKGSRPDNGGTVIVDSLGRSWERQYSGCTYFRWFGAIGDGSSDDLSQINSALQMSNVILDGEGKTYKVSGSASPISSKNLKIQNLTIDSSESISNIPILNFTGIRKSNISLTANLISGSSVLSVDSTDGILPGEYIYVGSDAYFSAGQNSKIGQISRVNTVDSSTQLTLFSPLLYAFSVSDAAYIQPLSVSSGISLERVNMIGNPSSSVLQEAVRASTCDGFTAIDCTFKNYNYASIRLDRSIGSRIGGCSFFDSTGAGLAYGVAVTFGCADTLITGCHGDNLRHLVSTGGNIGVNIYTRALYNYATSMWDAGLDCHCNSDFTDYSHNQIEMSASVAKEGIICQGGSINAIGNTIIGCKQYAIRYESITDGQETSVNISNNIIDIPTNHGIYVYTAVGYSTNITSLTINSNTIKGPGIQQHITAYAQGGSIFNVSISGNICEFKSSERCIYIRSINGAKIERIAITGNVAKSDSDSSVCWLIGDATSQINDVSISGNSFSGGDYSVYFNYVNRATVNSNNCVDFSVGKNRVTDTSTSIELDRSTIPVRTYSSGGTYTIQAEDKHLIINRAATVVLTLPSANTNPGREIFVKTIQSQAVNSATSNVAPISSSTLGSAILPATAGSWSLLVSDGANWVVMQRG